MLQYERKRQHLGSSLIRDVISHPAGFATDYTEVLQLAGFTPSESVLSGDADDPDEGGNSGISQLGGHAALCLQLWSIDEETGIKVRFIGARDNRHGILYMKMCTNTNDDSQGVERPTKSAITSLLDIADACRARKLTIGLGVEHAGSADFLCSLLYLGFQVVPSRKSPLSNCALLLDLDIGWPSLDVFSSTDGHGTCTSDCSTSAEDYALSGMSDLSGGE